MKKGYLVASFLVGALLLIGAGCQQVQQNSNTESSNENINAQAVDEEFVTYESEDMKVSFQYPADWTILEERVDSSWDKGIDGATAGVRFDDGAGNELVVGRKRSRTIDQELAGDTEIELEKVEDNPVEGYISAEVFSKNLFTEKESHSTWIEKEGDLIKLPSVNEYPEVADIVSSLTFLK